MSDNYKDKKIENDDVILPRAFVNKSPELKDNDDTNKVDKVGGDLRPRRPDPPSLPPPSLIDQEESPDSQAEEQKIQMLPIGPPPSYIPHNSNDDNEEDLHETGGSPDGKGGILFHKNSVRDPDRIPKHVTFGKLPRRHGDDPDPCLLIIIFVVFLIAVTGLVLNCLVLKGVLKVPNQNCTSNEIQHENACLFSQLASCPFGWILFEDSCYGIPLLESRNYTQARDFCFQYGAYPVSLETKRENYWFLSNVKKPRDALLNDDNPIFIGVKPRSNTSWESTKPVQFKNNLQQSFVADICYSLYSNGTWQPTDCAMKLAFYCERAKLAAY